MKRKTQKKPKTQQVKTKPREGRPRNPEYQWPIFDTLSQCSALASVPIAILKQAKSLGCPAFKHGRVYFGDFLPWLFTTMMSDSNVNWGEESKKLDVLLKRVELAEREGKIIDRNSVADGIAQAQSFLFGELDRVFVSELPARGKGMDELKLQNLSRGEIERLKDTLKNQFSKLSERKKQTDA